MTLVPEGIRTRLSRGFFAPRDDDAAVATGLSEGWLRISGVRVEVFEGSAYDRVEHLDRASVLALHSLRWLDTLRRHPVEEQAHQEAWSRILEAWWTSSTAQDRNSSAWSDIPLEQRAIALALGAPDDQADGCLAAHRRAIDALAQRTDSADRRLHLLDLQIALAARAGESEEAWRALAVEAARRAFREDGYAVTEDLSTLIDARSLWHRRLGEHGVLSDDPVHDRLDAVGFWLHSMAPDGSLVGIGGRRPAEIPGEADERMQYIRSAGSVGSPPDAISHVDPTGLVAWRSGWGETERDAPDETLCTMLLGPVRGRDAHQDVARVTYFSQGREWLVDPLDPEAAGVDCHSVVAVDEVRYRLHGGAELVRHYGDDQVEGLVAKCSLHLGVAWQRHLVFARTGNYLLVEDLVRSSRPYVASQQWMIAPDVAIEPTARGFLLHSGGRRVYLFISTLGLADHSIDELRSADGSRRIAWRIRVPLVGSSNRAVALLIDVDDPKASRVRRHALPGKDLALEIEDRRLHEMLVVTPELAAVVDAGSDPAEAVERTIVRAAAGTLTQEEQLAQRIGVRRALEAVKTSVREQGGTPAARLRGIEDLLAAGTELEIAGLRDHGFTSGLIDLAGTDLADRLENDPRVAAARRSPLVQWPGQELYQEGYGVRVRTTPDGSSLPDGADEPSVWSVDLGQLVPSAYLHHAPGGTLTVYFHGATDRTKFSMPRYERLRSMSGIGLGPVMFFSDPCLDLDSRMILSWYVGTEDVDLHRVIAQMIDTYARERGLDRVLLVGNSGGAFTALQIAALLDGARVVAFNPQVRVDDYLPRIAGAAHWSLFGRHSVADLPEHAARMDLVARYRDIGFDQDVVLIQNPGDDHHHQHHFLPFVKAFEDAGSSERLTLHTPYLGPGHRVPPTDDYLRIVRDAAGAATRSGARWHHRGLRDS